MNLLDQIRDNIRKALDERAAKQAEIDGILAAVETEGRSDLTADETTKFTEARTVIQSIDERVGAMRVRETELVEMGEARAAAQRIGDDLPARQDLPAAAPVRTSEVRVGQEELTYRRGGENSYFRDLVRAYEPGGNRDYRAGERIQRHAKEMEVELRANMSRTDGTGGEFVPPLWLMNQYIPLARAGRVTADLCRMLPLPTGTDSINLPKVSTGTATAEQADGQLGPEDRHDHDVSQRGRHHRRRPAGVRDAAARPVAAQRRRGRVRRPPRRPGDEGRQYVINKASHRHPQRQLGIIAVTYTDASPTVPELYPKVADGDPADPHEPVPAAAGDRHAPPPVGVAPRRARLLEPAARRPERRRARQNAFAGMSDVRAEGSVGTLQGLPVYVDPNVPINLGAGTNEDRIITPASMTCTSTRATCAPACAVRDRRRHPVGAAAGLGVPGVPRARYPKAIAVVTSGTGLVTPDLLSL
jgi:hypothetical protein